ncbi:MULTISPECIES: hypothetical protein [Cupriavidus]|uniref:hypothetical protein n=1 Tax=Cupriavidus TaxID=106589 RepID=UPI000045F9B9|nr:MULTISPECIES: hypothetical protein [Cupriavidus]QYY31131.1 hypothetical protein K2O51_27940 [Cupriavidus pinatubonensis]
MLEDFRYDMSAMCRLMIHGVDVRPPLRRFRVKGSQWPLSDEVRFDGDAEVAG